MFIKVFCRVQKCWKLHGRYFREYSWWGRTDQTNFNNFFGVIILSVTLNNISPTMSLWHFLEYFHAHAAVIENTHVYWVSDCDLKVNKKRWSHDFFIEALSLELAGDIHHWQSSTRDKPLFLGQARLAGWVLVDWTLGSTVCPSDFNCLAKLNVWLRTCSASIGKCRWNQAFLGPGVYECQFFCARFKIKCS